jgi:predicted glycogen debranching enzyme
MTLPVRTLTKRGFRLAPGDPHLNEEWLVTNGLGGYASGTVAGNLTRRYHGLLVAALHNPLGRTMMLNAVAERIRTKEREVYFTGPSEVTGERDKTLPPDEFLLDGGLPVWRYRIGGAVLEKRLFMPYRQNTVQVSYKLEGNEPVRIGLRPGVHFRGHDAPVSTDLHEDYVISVCMDGFELEAKNTDFPILRLHCDPHAAFTADRKTISEVSYPTEAGRGYESCGSMWSPGYFRFDLEPGQTLTFVASTELWDVVHAMSPEEAQASERNRRGALLNQAQPGANSGLGAELTLAADQFLIAPLGRSDDAARAHAVGEELRTVIAGYYWFLDWGRDTMISLEGLTLATGRSAEGKWILRTFAHYIKDGLIPNMFPEGQHGGLYNTADASVWFFHALARYLSVTNDRVTLEVMLPKLIDIVEHHIAGTKFNIRMDPKDCLISEGAEGVQLTWMDAKVGDWVVTPRRGKPVEINALWYNALRLLASWIEQEQSKAAAAKYSDLADGVRNSFNQRFWYEKGGYLFDVIDGPDGDDPKCRPNQIFPISLPHPVLARERWQPVLDVVQKKLLTPVGLRSLAPDDPDYKARYDGDLRARDAAYHQGTVWTWLIGPFVDAWLKVYPDRKDEARQFISAFNNDLSQACIGSISEVYDAEQPHTPRGCVAQAWSVAEVLRCWTMLNPKPGNDS